MGQWTGRRGIRRWLATVGGDGTATSLRVGIAGIAGVGGMVILLYLGGCAQVPPPTVWSGAAAIANSAPTAASGASAQGPWVDGDGHAWLPQLGPEGDADAARAHCRSRPDFARRWQVPSIADLRRVPRAALDLGAGERLWSATLAPGRKGHRLLWDGHNVSAAPRFHHRGLRVLCRAVGPPRAALPGMLSR